MHVEAAGDAQQFGEPAAEVDADRPAADDDLVGQLEGRDGVGEDEVVAVLLREVGTRGGEQGGWRPSGDARAGGGTNLDFGSTGGERHDADDVGEVGGQGAGGVSELQVVGVQVWHGRFHQRHRNPVWQALNGGYACEPEASERPSAEF